MNYLEMNSQFKLDVNSLSEQLFDAQFQTNVSDSDISKLNQPTKDKEQSIKVKISFFLSSNTINFFILFLQKTADDKLVCTKICLNPPASLLLCQVRHQVRFNLLSSDRSLKILNLSKRCRNFHNLSSGV